MVFRGNPTFFFKGKKVTEDIQAELYKGHYTWDVSESIKVLMAEQNVLSEISDNKKLLSKIAEEKKVDNV